MKPRFYKYRSTEAFTLVELLTVIAVIAILAGILIPVLGKVRRSAEKTACMSNLRQTTLAMLLYVGENKGWVVPKINIGEWPSLVSQYQAFKGDGRSSCVGCPSQRRSLDLKPDFRTYSINGKLTEAPQTNMAAYQYPSKTMFFSDGGFNAGETSYNIAVWKGAFGPELIHEGRANISFLDGHVESRNNNELPVNPDQNTEGYVLWFGRYAYAQ